MGPAHTSFFGPLFGGIAYYLSTLHLKPTYTSQSDLGSLFMGGGVDNGVGETYYCSEHSSVPIYMIPHITGIKTFHKTRHCERPYTIQSRVRILYK